MKTKKIEFISQIIFFGAIWGLLEATLGYVLHLLPALIAGSIMFPIAIFILFKAYKNTQSRYAILMIGILAMMIKSMNLMLPGHPAKTINPMIAMFIQSLIAFGVIPMFDKGHLTQKISLIIVMSVGWRMGMMFYYGYNYLTTNFLDFRLASFTSGFEFILIEGLISGVIAGLLVIGGDLLINRSFKKLTLNPMISVFILILAVFFTLYKF